MSPATFSRLSILLILVFLVAAVASEPVGLKATGRIDAGKQPPLTSSDKEGVHRKAQIAKRKTVREIETEFPSVDYDEPDDPDPVKHDKRVRSSSRHDGKHMVQKNPSKSVSGSVLQYDWEVGLDPIPAAQSKVVVVGDVVDAQAHMSNDRGMVYTEFTLRVLEVLKNETGSHISSGGQIIAERWGGVVRYAPDNSQVYQIGGQGFPRKGRRYVLFLDYVGPEDNLPIVAGFELREGKVFMLDGAQQFLRYKGMDETEFSKLVRDAAVNQDRR